MHVRLLSFSNNKRSLDFLSKAVDCNIITVSLIFFSIISSTISLIFSVVLEIIINFLSSKKDFENMLVKKLSLLFKISFSSYLYIESLDLHFCHKIKKYNFLINLFFLIQNILLSFYKE